MTMGMVARSKTNIRPAIVSLGDAIEKTKSKQAYEEILGKLKRDFLLKYERKTISSAEGLDDFIKVKTLGTGSFGRVILVRRRNDQGNNEFYAMKCIEKHRIVQTKQVDHTLNEKRIMESLRFPFIITLEYCFKDNSYIYFVMPFINGGEMFTHLRRMRRFSEDLSRFYASQVLLALEFLHFCDIIYRDLKPENILIDSKGYIKIGDLGFCKVVSGRTWTLCGTPEYIAPEIILSKGYGKAVDWWSYGVLLYEMNSGNAPFTSKDPMTVYEKIITCNYRCPPTFSADLQDIIHHLLQLDLSRRYGNLKSGTMDIKSHKWFKDLDFFSIYNQEIDAPFKPNVLSDHDTTNFDSYTEVPMSVDRHVMYGDKFEMF